jgi:hypothetical protein
MAADLPVPHAPLFGTRVTSVGAWPGLVACRACSSQGGIWVACWGGSGNASCLVPVSPRSARRSPAFTVAAACGRLCLIGTVSSYAPSMPAVPSGVRPGLAAWGHGPPALACCSSPATLLAVDETWVRRMPTLTGLVWMRVPLPVPSCPFWLPPQAHSVPELSMAYDA